MSAHDALEGLGGRAGVADAVGALYLRILDDPELAQYFDDVHLPRLRAHMVEFLIAALTDDPAVYTGRAMAEAHTGLAITGTAFDRVAGHLVTVLGEAGVPAATADLVLGRIAPLRPAIVAQ